MLACDHRKTAQFWMSYCKLVEVCLIMHRAVKINDIDLYAYSLFELARLFFIVKHLNYVRWMNYYSLELVNLKSEKLDFYILNSGGFSLDRTREKYCRTGVDIALKQIIHAKGKRRLKDIIAFADVSTAVNSWVVRVNEITNCK